ncbi:MAG: hypothetical protein HC767_06940 [Akkermansiaceae bacterium]|nr:hypothetical protein [Akkermansiaceae bacterium]
MRLSPGCGLSSDGDLFCFTEEKLFTHFTKFQDNEAKYPPFSKIEDFIELLPEKNQIAEAQPLTEEQLKDRIAVLYLESYVKEPDFCTTENCDNQGLIQHNNLRLLLVPRKMFHLYLRHFQNLLQPSMKFMRLDPKSKAARSISLKIQEEKAVFKAVSPTQLLRPRKHSSVRLKRFKRPKPHSLGSSNR